MKIVPHAIAEIAIEASAVVMKHYASASLQTMRKLDNSAVTNADHDSSDLIIKRLNALHSGVPVVSEEGDEATNLDVVKNADLFWLVDPIDGTWGFINQCGDFVINIALIKNGEPIFGVINAPLRQATYFHEDDKIYKLQKNKAITVKPNRDFSKGFDFLVSDSNINQSTQDFIDGYKVKTLTPVPSAYKFALMAEGKGDIYPRFKPTYAWDTASGHALLRAVGGEIYGLDNRPLRYNQALLNPSFVAVVDSLILTL